MSALDQIARIAAVSNSERVGPTGRRFAIMFGPGDGWIGIEQSPASLARAANLSLDVYALARLSASENSSDGPAYRLAVAECGRNEVQRRKDLRVVPRAATLSIAGNLIERTRSGKYERTRGHFGQQRGRWASTIRNPSKSDVLAAHIAIHENSNLAKGAHRFFDPKTQNGGTQAGRELSKDAEDVIIKWGAEGSVWVGPVPGIDPYKLMLFRKEPRAATKAEIDFALAANDRGRAGASSEEPLRNPRIADSRGDKKIPFEDNDLAIVFGSGILEFII